LTEAILYRPASGLFPRPNHYFPTRAGGDSTFSIRYFEGGLTAFFYHHLPAFPDL
jgi:hypothetical protein